MLITNGKMILFLWRLHFFRRFLLNLGLHFRRQTKTHSRIHHLHYLMCVILCIHHIRHQNYCWYRRALSLQLHLRVFLRRLVLHLLTLLLCRGRMITATTNTGKPRQSPFLYPAIHVTSRTASIVLSQMNVQNVLNTLGFMRTSVFVLSQTVFSVRILNAICATAHLYSIIEIIALEILELWGLLG